QGPARGKLTEFEAAEQQPGQRPDLVDSTLASARELVQLAIEADSIGGVTQADHRRAAVAQGVGESVLVTAGPRHRDRATGKRDRFFGIVGGLSGGREPSEDPGLERGADV